MNTRPGFALPLTVLATLLLTLSASAAEDKSSPWLFTPTLSSSPKLGTSAGALAAYLHDFDEDSPTSMFGITGNYSDTDSWVGGTFGKVYFRQDSYRLAWFLGGGLVRNEFEDFLGTGRALSSNDDLGVYALSYLQQLRGHWYAGVQTVGTDYAIYADDPTDQAILQLIGLTGTRSVGAGLQVQYDSRDNQNSPLSGVLFELKHLANRRALGSEDNYDGVRLKAAHFIRHGNDAVLAINLSGRWTADAPASALSSINLPGYVRGQYLAKHTSSLLAEERLPLGQRFGVVAFAGIGCLYQRASDCGAHDNRYASGGAGAFFVLKPEERMVIRVDAAYGEASNRGYYIRFGHPF